jgi:hypothetical protein
MGIYVLGDPRWGASHYLRASRIGKGYFSLQVASHRGDVYSGGQ